MRYVRNSLPDWNTLPWESVLELRPFHSVPIGPRLLLVALDSPGWVLIRPEDLEIVNSLHGKTWGNCHQLAPKANFIDLVKSLFAHGLVALNGLIGLSGIRECNNPVVEVSSPIVQIQKTASRPIPVPHTLLLKLTGQCNWACTYCYDFDPVRFSKKLCLEDIRHAIQEMLTEHRAIRIVFHGGEPLLNYSELRRISEYARSQAETQNSTVSLSLQTNGSLLDGSKISFLYEYDFSVGMSVDGPPIINDLTRIDSGGQGTSKHFLRLFEAFPDFMQKRVGYLTTVTHHNIDQLTETAEFLKTVGARSWKTIVLDREGRAKHLPIPEVPAHKYIRFLRWMVDQCSSSTWKDFRFVTILEILDTIFRSERNNICMRFPCGAGREFAVAGADGKLLACDATYDDAFDLGPLTDSLSTSQQNPKADHLFEREAWLLEEAECATCPWLHFCAGACMAKALLKHGTIKAVDEFECAVRKSLFPYIFETFARSEDSLYRYYRQHRVSSASVDLKCA